MATEEITDRREDGEKTKTKNEVGSSASTKGGSLAVGATPSARQLTSSVQSDPPRQLPDPHGLSLTV